MKIKSVKPGDIIHITPQRAKEEKANKDMYFDERWKVTKVYRNFVLAHSVKVPAIRRCFCYGDLVMLGLETQRVKI